MSVSPQGASERREAISLNAGGDGMDVVRHHDGARRDRDGDIDIDRDRDRDQDRDGQMDTDTLCVQLVLDFRLSDLGDERGVLEFTNDLVIDVAEALFIITHRLKVHSVQGTDSSGLVEWISGVD